MGGCEVVLSVLACDPIQGAVFWDWTKDAIDTSAAAPVQLQQDPELLAAALEAKGVSHEKPVVVSSRPFACSWLKQTDSTLNTTSAA